MSSQYTIGKYDFQTGTLQTGLGTVNSSYLQPGIGLVTMDNKFFMWGQGSDSSTRGLYLVNPSTATVTAHLYPESTYDKNANPHFIGDNFTAYYFGTYKNLMYFCFPKGVGDGQYGDSPVRVMAINRDTGDLDHYYDVPLKEPVTPYNSNSPSQYLNYAWYETKLDSNMGCNGCSILEIDQGTYQSIKSEQYLPRYASNSYLIVERMYSVHNRTIGDQSQVNCLYVKNASIQTVGKLTLTVVSKTPQYAMTPA